MSRLHASIERLGALCRRQGLVDPVELEPVLMDLLDFAERDDDLASRAELAGWLEVKDNNLKAWMKRYPNAIPIKFNNPKLRLFSKAAAWGAIHSMDPIPLLFRKSKRFL